MITACQQLIWTVMGLESREHHDPAKATLKRTIIQRLSEEPTGTGLLLELYTHISFRVPQVSQIAPRSSQLRLQSSIVELVLFTLQRAHELGERRIVEEIVIMCLMDNEALVWATLGRKRFEEYLKIRKTYFVDS